jgi:hypothetical protein
MKKDHKSPCTVNPGSTTMLGLTPTIGTLVTVNVIPQLFMQSLRRINGPGFETTRIRTVVYMDESLRAGL